MVTIYTFTTCPYCIKAKNLLKSLEVEYEEINITGDQEALNALTKRSGMRTVPQIYVGDTCLGGYNDISSLHEKGELLEKFKV
jgi:glutaredoxin 3